MSENPHQRALVEHNDCRLISASKWSFVFVNTLHDPRNFHNSCRFDANIVKKWPTSRQLFLSSPTRVWI